MTHGDDDGLVIPPKVAATQVMVVTAGQDEGVIKAGEKLVSQLKAAGIRARGLLDTEHSLGWKLNQAEILGTPINLIVGQKELDTQSLTAAIRHSHQKQPIAMNNITDEIQKLLGNIQDELFANAQKRQAELTHEADTYDTFKKIMENERGFIKAFWCETAECEKTIKDETKATTRCLPFIDNEGNVQEEKGTCIKCGQPATHRWLFAQSY